MDNTGLVDGLREDGVDRVGEADQAVGEDKQHVLDAAVAELRTGMKIFHHTAILFVSDNHLYGGNFSAKGGFMPFGWKGVFLAIASGGVIFAYLGFEQAIQLGGA
jgi:hypothetical protein